MEYMLMLIGEEPDFEQIDPDEMQQAIDMMSAFNQELKEAGVLVRGNGLRQRATATTVHFDMEGQQTITDGPFAETKEQLMGYWILECRDLDEALAWTRKVPMRGASIEVRPLVEDSGTQEIDGLDRELTGAELLERVRSRDSVAGRS